MGFSEALKETEKDLNNTSYTENGAKGYKTSGNALVDLNFKVSSLRGMDMYDVYTEFCNAWDEDEDLALKWLFYARDIRYGLGERHIFKSILHYMAIHKPYQISHLISMIPEYGRWDDLFVLKGTSLEKDMIKIISEQLESDIATVTESMSEKDKKMVPISLLAKWMPSINCHSKDTRYYAKMFANRLGLTLEEYRKMLKSLREYIDIVESKMSANQWDKIDYSAVPARANLIYAKAFYRHDQARRQEYIDAVKEGKEKINSGTLYPHEIVYKLASFGYGCDFDLSNVSSNHISQMTIEIDTMEELWKALPDVVSGNESRVLFIRDGSSSMVVNKVPKTNISIWDVATSLTIYFSERNQSEFHNKFITFSRIPELVEIPEGLSLFQKLGYCNQYRKAENTDIEAVFDLILRTAVDNKMKQEDLPETLLIASDMEFDNCTVGHAGYLSPKLFEEISRKYDEHGYKLPRLVFWNINSRTNTIAVKENECGVLLLSGYSINLFKMVLGNEIDPYKALVSQLMSDRYKDIRLLTESLLHDHVDSIEPTEESQELLTEYLKTLGFKIHRNNQ